MAYSEARVIAGGLAHIPILIGIFWFINSYFNKRRNIFEKANNPVKSKPIAKPNIKTIENPPIKKVVNKVSDTSVEGKLLIYLPQSWCMEFYLCIGKLRIKKT